MRERDRHSSTCLMISLRKTLPARHYQVDPTRPTRGEKFQGNNAIRRDTKKVRARIGDRLNYTTTVPETPCIYQLPVPQYSRPQFALYINDTINSTPTEEGDKPPHRMVGWLGLQRKSAECDINSPSCRDSNRKIASQSTRIFPPHLTIIIISPSNSLQNKHTTRRFFLPVA